MTVEKHHSIKKIKALRKLALSVVAALCGSSQKAELVQRRRHKWQKCVYRYKGINNFIVSFFLHFLLGIELKSGLNFFFNFLGSFYHLI